MTSTVTATAAITATLATVADDHFEVHGQRPPSGPPWWRWDELTSSAALQRRLAEMTPDHDDDARVATAFLAARLLSPLARLAVRPVVTLRRAVVVTSPSLWLRRNPRDRHDGMAVIPDRVVVMPDDPLGDTTDVVADKATVGRRAVASAVELAAPVIDRLRDVGRLGTRAMWGQLADSMVSAVARHHDPHGDAVAARHDVQVLLGVDDRLWVDPEIAHVEVDGRVGLAWRRGSCCLAWRLDRFGWCGGCPLVHRDEWWERSVASVRSRTGKVDRT